MTKERSIPECVELIQMVLLSLQNSKLPDIPYSDDARHCLKIIKEHCKRVDAEGKEMQARHKRLITSVHEISGCQVSASRSIDEIYGEIQDILTEEEDD